MTRPVSPGGSRRGASAAKWSVAAALALSAGALLWAAGAGEAQDIRAGAAGGGGNVLVVAGQVTSDSYGLYLVDTRANTLCVYQWRPSAAKPGIMELRLMAARNFAFDLQLEDFNNEKQTSPAEIRKMVAEQRRLGSATQPN